MDLDQQLFELTSLTVGCTDVGAIGYAAAIARDALKDEPKLISILLSDEIFKNSKCVGVPGSGERGPIAAALLGAVIGEPDRKLSIFHQVSDENLIEMKTLREQIEVELVHEKCESPMWVKVRMESKDDECEVILAFKYDYLFQLTHNGRLLVSNPTLKERKQTNQVLQLATILSLVEQIDQPSPGLLKRIAINVDPIEPMPDSIQSMMFALHRKVFLTTSKRMRGEVLPIVSFCGSGNLGIASANTIDALTRFYRSDELEKTKAAVLYLLIVQAIKESMTLLTVMCGTAIAAGAAAAAANLYLKGSDSATIQLAVNQALSESLGVICDGAKESCATKTASRVLEGILQSEYVAEDLAIHGEQGVVVARMDETIRRISKLNNEEMEVVNQAILHMI